MNGPDQQQGEAAMTVRLPDQRLDHWRDRLPDLLSNCSERIVDLDCGDWILSCSDLKDLSAVVDHAGHQLGRITSRALETVVSASALGLDASPSHSLRPRRDEEPDALAGGRTDLVFHHGTLRSGDHLQSDRSILLYGDVNPGARISSAGDVLVWGRLRGVAHAGCEGSTTAKIIALQLRPLQLRIADVVARGPEDLPQAGLAEQAELKDGVIAIEPAVIQSFQKR